MPTPRYCVKLVEIDGVELEFGEELALDAGNVWFDDSNTSLGVDNVQDAIEGSIGVSNSILVPLVFVNSGNTSDKWLGFANNAFPSNVIPLIVPNNSELYGITFSNADDNVDIDIEIYINGVLSHTENIRNKRWFYTTNITSIISASAGDRVSVFLKKFIGGSGDSTPQDPIIVLYFRGTTNVTGSGGQQTGVT